MTDDLKSIQYVSPGRFGTAALCFICTLSALILVDNHNLGPSTPRGWLVAQARYCNKSCH